MIRLLKFEAEKLIRSPIVLIGLAVLLGANLFLFGRLFWGRDGGAEGAALDREASTAFAGRCFDAQTCAEIKAGIENGSLSGTSVARIYDNIFRSIDEWEAGQGQWGFDPESGTVRLPPDRASSYAGLGLDTIPYSWQTGWNMWIYLAESMTGLLLLYLIVSTATLFSGEYANRTAAILLAAKYGKTRVIGAKLLLGVGWNLAVTILLLGGSFLACGLGYGFDGLDGQLRMLFMTNNNYAAMVRSQTCILTTGEFILAYVLFALAGAIGAAVICMALSAAIKSSAGAVIASLAACYCYDFVILLLPKEHRLALLLENLPGEAAMLYSRGMRYLEQPQILSRLWLTVAVGAVLLIPLTILAARRYRA